MPTSVSDQTIATVFLGAVLKSNVTLTVALLFILAMAPSWRRCSCSCGRCGRRRGAWS